jgi:hypothetical protein
VTFISFNFGLKPTLPDMSMATTTCFQLPVAWYIMFHPFAFSAGLCVFVSGVYVLQTTSSWMLFLNPTSWSAG